MYKILVKCQDTVYNPDNITEFVLNSIDEVNKLIQATLKKRQVENINIINMSCDNCKRLGDTGNVCFIFSDEQEKETKCINDNYKYWMTI